MAARITVMDKFAFLALFSETLHANPFSPPHVQFGVPQERILGPFLLSTCIDANDFQNAPPRYGIIRQVMCITLNVTFPSQPTPLRPSWLLT